MPKIKPQRNFLISIKGIINEYLGVTSIHGLRYLMESRNIVEKVSWLIIISLSFGFCVHIIHSHFTENNNKPILTTVEMASVQEIPFPAITIRYILHHIWYILSLSMTLLLKDTFNAIAYLSMLFFKILNIYIDIL